MANYERPRCRMELEAIHKRPIDSGMGTILSPSSPESFTDLHHAPILKLDLDVLEYIFLLNSNMHGEGIRARYDPLTECAYNTTRYSAQTCRLWRTLALKSSMLWANVVDLNALQCGKEIWRGEFMKRTGKTALLSVKGKVDGNAFSFFAFFIFLLDDNWGRIRTFNVALKSELHIVSHLPFLSKKAEHLELFHFVWAPTGITYTWQEANAVVTTLFSDDAPRLRYFYCKGIYFHLQAPWMRQLRSLFIPSHFRVGQILDALTQLPVLESLEVDSMGRNESNPPASSLHIQLPRLKNLRLSGKLENTLAILRSVFPPPGCALSLNAFRPSSSSITDLNKILEKFWKSYSAFTAITKFAVYINQESYQMTTIPAFHREPPAFSVCLTFSSFFDPNYHPLFIGTLSSAGLMHLKEFHFYQDRSDNIDPLDPTLVSFISSQQLVESLVATDSSLTTLLKISSIHPILLPHLHSVKLCSDDPRKPKYEVPQVLVDFLSSRSAANMPVSVVDLTEFWMVKMEDLHVLDGMEGLTILLKNSYYSKVSEYLCGHGLVGEEYI